MFGIKRVTKYEKVYSLNMGELTYRITRIYKTFLNVKYKKLYEYRETYYGEVKDLEDCDLKK